jgi:hypothetical protein
MMFSVDMPVVVIGNKVANKASALATVEAKVLFVVVVGWSCLIPIAGAVAGFGVALVECGGECPYICRFCVRAFRLGRGRI